MFLFIYIKTFLENIISTKQLKWLSPECQIYNIVNIFGIQEVRKSNVPRIKCQALQPSLDGLCLGDMVTSSYDTRLEFKEKKIFVIF